MKLLLSGGGTNKPLDEYFISQIDLKGTVLFIPIAWDESFSSYNHCFEHFSNIYNHYGIKNIKMCTDLFSIQNLHKYNAIYFEGGNTFKLLKAIKESKFDLKIIEYLNNNGLIYGFSAGAIIFGNSIESAYFNDDNDVGLEDLTGFNLVGGNDIFCHYSENDNEENEYIKNYPNDLFILCDGSGLLVLDYKIQSMGKMYLSKNDIRKNK